MPKCTRLLIFLLFFAAMAQGQPPAPYHKYSRKELSEVKTIYGHLTKEYNEIQKKRQALETALKDYDSRMKMFSEHMARWNNGWTMGSGLTAMIRNISWRRVRWKRPICRTISNRYNSSAT